MEKTKKRANGNRMLWFLFVLTSTIYIYIGKGIHEGNIEASRIGGKSAYSSRDNEENVGSYPSVEGAITTVEGLDDATPFSRIGKKYSVKKDEFIHLCNLVCREAGNGQLDEWEAALVVETVMNRVLAKDHPATINEVIREPKQYSGWLSTFKYSECVNYYVKDVVLGYLNGDYINHGLQYYWGDEHHNYFFITHEPFRYSYYDIYQNNGTVPTQIINYK